MAIDYQRMQARTTRMLRQNGATYNVTRKGSVTVIGGVEHKTEEVRFTAVGVKTEYAPAKLMERSSLTATCRSFYVRAGNQNRRCG